MYSSSEELARSKCHDEKFSQANSGRRIPQIANTAYELDPQRYIQVVQQFLARHLDKNVQHDLVA